jgi:biotin operon repressor
MLERRLGRVSRDILVTLADEGPCTTAEIAACLERSEGAVDRCLQRLRMAGLSEQIVGGSGRRLNQLTAEGRAFLRATSPKLRAEPSAPAQRQAGPSPVAARAPGDGPEVKHG